MDAAIPLGILIGTISGLAAVLLIKIAFQGSRVASILSAIGELLALPTFWFGGPWLTTRIIQQVQLSEDIYVLSVALVFMIWVSFPMFRLVIAVGNMAGNKETEGER